MKQTTNEEAGKCSHKRFPAFDENIHSITDLLDNHMAVSMILALMMFTLTPVIGICGVFVLPVLPSALSYFLMPAFLAWMGWFYVIALFFLLRGDSYSTSAYDAFVEKFVAPVIEGLLYLVGYPMLAVFLVLTVGAIPITLLVDVVRNVQCRLQHKP